MDESSEDDSLDFMDDLPDVYTHHPNPGWMQTPRQRAHHHLWITLREWLSQHRASLGQTTSAHLPSLRWQIYSELAALWPMDQRHMRPPWRVNGATGERARKISQYIMAQARWELDDLVEYGIRSNLSRYPIQPVPPLIADNIRRGTRHLLRGLHALIPQYTPGQLTHMEMDIQGGYFVDPQFHPRILLNDVQNGPHFTSEQVIRRLIDLEEDAYQRDLREAAEDESL